MLSVRNERAPQKTKRDIYLEFVPDNEWPGLKKIHGLLRFNNAACCAALCAQREALYIWGPLNTKLIMYGDMYIVLPGYFKV